MSPLPIPPATSPGRILIVDDHPLNRLLLKDALEKAGYQVLEAEEGEPGLAIALAGGIEVLLLDVMMPGMDGFEVCRRLRADPRTAALPILLVTALKDRENRIRGIEAGANDFISKPLDTVELLLRVRNAVAAKRLYDGMAALVHELTPPLTELSGHLDVLDRSMQQGADPEARQRLDAARRVAGQLTGMVVAALTGARPEPHG